MHPDLTIGGPPECERRALCLAGLEHIYGLKFKEFVPLDAGGPLTHAALADGVVDVALLFTTDPALASSDLVVLADDRALQPAENVTPLVRTRRVERAGPALAAAVDAVSATTHDRGVANPERAGGGHDGANGPRSRRAGWKQGIA